MPKPFIRDYPPHFDARLTETEAGKLVSDPQRVAQHPFYPFLERNQRWTKFTKRGEKAKEKSRPIRYAARRDAYIFAHYRSILLPLYESELQNLKLTECVLAYRHIGIPGKKSGKCNIHFASEAFDFIRSLGECSVLALDVSQFFENLDHEHIKRMWSRLLGKTVSTKNSLPLDHFRVFDAVTRYACIDRDQAYKKLGLIAEVTSANGQKKFKYLTSRENFPLQICTPALFRKDLEDLIKVNPDSYGIPQGSPISDLLANLYMLEFDDEMNKFIWSNGGRYLRYSDDILIIVPRNNWSEILRTTKSILKRTAPRLETKPEKTQIYTYQSIHGSLDQSSKPAGGTKGSDGLEYLGFRYDGKRIFLRNSTVSGFRRKISAVSERMAINHVNFNPNASLAELTTSFNFNVLIAKFGRIEGFDFAGKEYTTWTFWTYILRSTKILGNISRPLMRQINDYKVFARRRAIASIQLAYKRAHHP